jgi:hypothetical protein
LPRGWSLTAPAAHHDAVSYQRRIFIIDGYEQFSAWQRLRLKIRCRRRGSGLLVTSHTATGLPTLIQLAPDRRLVEDLVGHLCSNVSSGVTPADVAASHACHGTNVRDILFDLYDRHEHWRHKNRTPRLAGT